MCNLYDIGPAPRRRRYDWESELIEILGETVNVAPGRSGVVAVADDSSPTSARPIAARMHWGYRRTFRTGGKPIPRQVNNARDDKLEGRMWADSFENRRCVIPAIQFYEWSGPKGKKTKHAIRAVDEETAGSEGKVAGDDDGEAWFWIAGIWEDDFETTDRRSYSMITTSSPEAMVELHDRTPCLLLPDDVEEYLFSDEPPRHLVRPYPGKLSINPPLMVDGMLHF
ncbi:MAG: SOS response-associated peptidase family protein [Verrucomicrobiota bacterium]